MTDHVTVERDDAVQIIRFNRLEKKNAITAAMYQAMADALNAANDDGEIGASLFLGQPGIFTAGNDIQDFLATSQGQGLGLEVLAFLRALANNEKPIIAGVDGMAIGVGTTMLFHCDLVYASDRSSFRTPFLDLGLVPEAASSLIAPQKMGHQRAFSLLAMGETFDPAQALESGMVNAVYNPDDLEAHAIMSAKAAANRPPQAMKIARDLMRGSRQEILQRIDEEAKHFAAQLKSEEARNAFMAFMSRGKK